MLTRSQGYDALGSPTSGVLARVSYMALRAVRSIGINVRRLYMPCGACSRSSASAMPRKFTTYICMT